MEYKLGDVLVFDGKEINIKMQMGLSKGDEVEFMGYYHLGMLLKKDNNYEFVILSGQKKHFKRIK